ncbi:MAG TPA: GNAT family N-acetyltransferase [Ktedonobacterales bacterium]|nr:GNAT family N-acetyltransferase [Ktedonobacterales bacterium]
MAHHALDITRLDAVEAQALLPGLIHLLRETVESGASIGFWSPLAEATAAEYWRDVIADVDADRRVLLVARQGQAIVGSVQLEPAHKRNGAHRAEVQKLMVTLAARRQGIGRTLLDAIEDEARLDGRTLLVLDTQRGSPAEALYAQHGYTRVGVIPGYTVEADGSHDDTVIFYRQLS